MSYTPYTVVYTPLHHGLHPFTPWVTPPYLHQAEIAELEHHGLHPLTPWATAPYTVGYSPLLTPGGDRRARTAGAAGRGKGR